MLQVLPHATSMVNSVERMTHSSDISGSKKLFKMFIGAYEIFWDDRILYLAFAANILEWARASAFLVLHSSQTVSNACTTADFKADSDQHVTPLPMFRKGAETAHRGTIKKQGKILMDRLYPALQHVVQTQHHFARSTCSARVFSQLSSSAGGVSMSDRLYEPSASCAASCFPAPACAAVFASSKCAP